MYHRSYYKLIIIDLSTKTTSIPQQINFVEKLGKDNCSKMFVMAEKQQKNCSKLFFRFIKCSRIIFNIFNDQSNANYDVGNEIIYNIEVVKSIFCD